jgi:hypothetical protein
VTTFIIGLFACGYLIIWFCRRGWRLVARYVICTILVLVFSIQRACLVLAFFLACHLLRYQESIYVTYLCITAAVYLAIPNIIERVERARWFENVVKAIQSI